jgi:hypothetical protein
LVDFLADELHGVPVRHQGHAHARRGLDVAARRIAAAVLKPPAPLALSTTLALPAAVSLVATVALPTAITLVSAFAAPAPVIVSAFAVASVEPLAAFARAAAARVSTLRSAAFGRFGALGPDGGFLGIAGTRPGWSHQQIGQRGGVGFVFGSAHGAERSTDAEVWKAGNARLFP